MNCCYIFGAAEITDYSYIHFDKQDDDYIICADGGYKHANRLSIEPDVVIGDFDSAPKPDDIFVIEYPTKKDDTDMMLAIKAGLSSEYKMFKIYGGLGGRFDHSIANVSALIYLNMHGARGILYDENNIVYVMSDCDKLTLKRQQGCKISLLALTEKVTGVTTSGLEYSLDNDILYNSNPLGVSNEFSEDYAEITTEAGNLLIILSKE